MTLGEKVEFRGRCDASGGIAVDETSWIGGNDEENSLLLYATGGGGAADPPILPLSDFLGIPTVGDDLEADLESATAVGDVVYWLASHSQSKKGKPRPYRHRLFATRIRHEAGSPQLERVGTPCTTLRDTLVADPRFAPFALAAAATLPPKAPGGFNLEAICATPDGATLWIGFRNPIPDGKALLVGVLNPTGITAGVAPVLSDPTLVDLQGLGFRDMVWTGSEYLVLAGDFLDRADPGARPSQLFRWGGPGSAAESLGIDFGDLNPEALVRFSSGRTLVVSDDGTRKCDGDIECKDVKDWSKKGFRAVWLAA
jgi:hypothetical protein